MEEKPKVLALTDPKSAGAEFIADFKSRFHLDVLQVRNREEAVPAIASAVGKSGPYYAFLVLMGKHPYVPFDQELLGPLTLHCRIIVCASAGYNEFDIDWMTKNKIWFCNTRDAVSEPTADMALFLTLAVVRDTTRAEKSVRTGLWRSDLVPFTDPTGLTLGIIGMGAIGKHLARKAAAFNMKIQYHNRTRLPLEVEALHNAKYCPTLENLLNTSDVVSVNCPLNAATTGLNSHKEFSQMKTGAFFVNTSRGPVVDESALIAALKSGKVARAGLDVFENEPDINQYFIDNDRCTIQPHVVGLTDRAWKDAERECFANITALFETGRPIGPVNELGK